jgi:hypothetical protein
MAQQDRVAVVGVEAAPRLVGDHDLVEGHAAVERDRPIEVEELPVTRGVTGMPCPARRPWLARHLLLLALVSWWTPHEEAELPCSRRTTSPQSGMAPWGFLPGCRIDAPKADDHS